MNVSEDGEFSYPAVVWVENAGESLAAEVTGRPVVIVAIADAFEAWESEEAFYESESGLASRAFVPIGMFVTPPRRRGFRKPPEPLPEPRALLAGVVASADVRENGWTGGRFATVTLDGYGAATYDVVAPLDLLPTGAAVGSIAEIHATLVARVVLDR